MTSCRLFATAMILGCCHVAALADPENVTMERLLVAPNNGDDWLTYGRTYSEQRFSPLAEINVDTVEALHVDWFADIHSEDGLVSTPIVVDGSRIKKGMLPFHESLTVEDSEAVHAYVIQRSREDFDNN